MSEQIQQQKGRKSDDKRDGPPRTNGADPASVTDTDAEGTEESPVTEKEAEESEPLSLDVIFEILKNRRRRLVMHELQVTEGETTLSDLAEHIGGIENDKPRSALGAQERKRVYVGLYQCHLPKMDDADVIEFDQNRGTVALGPNAELLYEFLEEEPEPEPRWERYYLVHAGASVAAFLTAAAMFEPLTTAVFIASLAALVCLAAVHARYDREE